MAQIQDYTFTCGVRDGRLFLTVNGNPIDVKDLTGVRVVATVQGYNLHLDSVPFMYEQQGPPVFPPAPGGQDGSYL